MTKTEEIIRTWVLNNKSFTYYSDIAEHTIWGFKNAPFKNWKRAINKVKDVIYDMCEEGLVNVERGEEGYQNIIHLTKG